MTKEFFTVISSLFEILENWWWVLLPFLLIRLFLYFWLWWKRTLFYKGTEQVLLEIKVPAEQVKTPQAMEQVLSGLHVIYGGPNRRETWIDGEINLWFSLEIASIDGVPHFFIRSPKKYQNLVESSIYSQYPDAEIFEVEDYTKNVPQDIPNGDWDLWGRDIVLKNDDPYPIKTYKEFVPPREKEEKVVDPVANLLEGMGKLKKGEQIWIQFLIRPITAVEMNLEEMGRKLVDKLVKRPKTPKIKPIIIEAGEILVKGPPEEVEAKRELIPPEMKLTPGEREVVEAIEGKISKPYFQTAIKVLYLGKGDAYFVPNASMPMGFFNSFLTLNLNRFKSIEKTKTKTQVLKGPRVCARKKKIFWLYRLRLPPIFLPEAPVTSDYWSVKGGTSILNIEEVASLFHFPSRIVAPAPTMERIEAKKGEPPPELPIE